MDFFIIGGSPEQVAAMQEQIQTAQNVGIIWAAMYPSFEVTEQLGYTDGVIHSQLN